jgi:hypothetical protein
VIVVYKAKYSPSTTIADANRGYINNKKDAEEADCFEKGEK